jgi:hypothetical protein
MAIKDSFNRLTRLSDQSDIRDFVKMWCSTYDGKIIDFDLGEETFHLVFRADGSIVLEDGLSTSFDLRLITTPQLLIEILKGSRSMKEVLKTGELKTWGNFHEAKQLEQFARFIIE